MKTRKSISTALVIALALSGAAYASDPNAAGAHRSGPQLEMSGMQNQASRQGVTSTQKQDKLLPRQRERTHVTGQLQTKKPNPDSS